MNCSNCEKQFSKKSNLIRHQKLNNCLSKCPHCDVMCRRAIHILNCPTLLNERIKELEKKQTESKANYDPVTDTKKEWLDKKLLYKYNIIY